MARVVLDSSALLAYINGETGADRVAEVIGDAVMSSVNLAETISKLVERNGSLPLAQVALGVVEFDVIDFDRSQAEEVGGLVPHTRAAGLSLGDRACLALAARENLPVVTGDRAWTRLGLDVEVELIR